MQATQSIEQTYIGLGRVANVVVSAIVQFITAIGLLIIKCTSIGIERFYSSLLSLGNLNCLIESKHRRITRLLGYYTKLT